MKKFQAAVCGERANGSVFNSIIAGLPDDRARSKAGKNSSVFVTVSQKPPYDFASNAKLGFNMSVPDTRPG